MVYPIYLIITILATPLPLLLNGLNLILLVLTTILYPLTSTIRLMTRTFLVGPFSVLLRIAEALYPIGSFVAGVVGVGCVMGAGAGYVGKAGLNLLLGRGRKDRAKKVKRSRSDRKSTVASSEGKEGTAASLPVTGSRVKEGRGERRDVAANGEKKERPRQISTSSASEGEVPYTPTEVFHPKMYVELGSTRKEKNRVGGNERVNVDITRGTAREGNAMGVRRRTSHLGR